MMEGLYQFQKQFPGLVSRVRGRGTFCAMDLPTVQARDKFLVDCRESGVHLGGCGNSSVRFRPSLTFTPAQANIMLDVMEQVLKKY
jgi:4-aminobutyrate aminotransferase-like enzyme